MARKSGKDTPETNPYIKKFLNKTKWKPDMLGVFAGKVDYPSYNFLNKHTLFIKISITSNFLVIFSTNF